MPPHHVRRLGCPRRVFTLLGRDSSSDVPISALTRSISTSSSRFTAVQSSLSPKKTLNGKRKVLSTRTYQPSEGTRSHGIYGVDRVGVAPKQTTSHGSAAPKKSNFFRNIIKYGGIAALVELGLIFGGVGGLGWWNTSKTDTSDSVQDSPVRDEQDIVRDTYISHMNDLRAKEQRGKFYTALGDVIRFHGVQHASNSPCEDEMVHCKADSNGPQEWAYWAVFDGHAGGATSKLLKQGLITEVAKNLTKLEDEELVEENIKSTFKKVDDQIVQRGLEMLYSATGHDSEKSKTALAQAYAGSCALFAMLDPSTSNLRVAVTGDSRAVLGECTTTGYTAKALSIDQNGHNPQEVERMARDHPGEDSVINPKSGRVLGIAISRAFGDARWKWSEEDSLLANEKFGGPRMRGLGPPGSVKTPPYLTAEPEIIQHTVAMGKDVENADFLIMASDGFWDHISSEDAVTCVAEWVKSQSYATKYHKKAPPGISNPNDRRLWSAFSKASPIEWPLKKGSGVWGDWHVKPEDFVYEEQNAATHLVQNAFGGRRRGLFCGAMAEKYPLSRWARDDISVYVVFFGKVGGKIIVDEPELRIV